MKRRHVFRGIRPFVWAQILTAILTAILVPGGAVAAEAVRVPRGLAVSPDGATVWVAAEDGVWSLDASSGAFTRHAEVPAHSIALDGRGEPWAGTNSGVLSRRDGVWRGIRDGLPSPIVLAILVSRSDGVYAGTDRGIARLGERAGAFEPLLDSHEFCRDAVLAIGEGAGGIWFARERAFERLAPGGRFEIFQKDFLNPDRACPLLGRYPRTLAISPAGVVWMATEGGLDLLDPGGESGRSRGWEQIPFLTGPVDPSGLPSAEVRGIAFTKDGAAWLAFGDAGIAAGGLGIARIPPGGGRPRRFGPADGLPGGRVHALATASDGTLWTATQRGLARLRGDAWTPFLWPPSSERR